jgi:spermidine/putrescine transport system substrate-binding protein
VTRRDFLTGVLGAAGAASLLAACGSGPSSSTTGTGAVTGAGSGSPTTAPGTLRWASWPLYLDEDDSGGHPSLDAFTQQTGVQVEYTEAIEDNESFTDPLLDLLTAGKDIGYDVVTLTDWMAARWIREGWAATFDRSRMPDADNIVPSLAGTDFDVTRTYSLTWQSGFAGLAWDTQAVPGGLHAVSDLWAPALAGKVDVLSEMRDTMGLLLGDMGVDPSSSWSDAEFVAALDVLAEQIASGQVRRVSGNSYTDDLVSGAAVAAIAWSGDIMALNAEEPGRFGFALPDSGGMLWSDNLLIAASSPARSAAEDLINFYYDPKVAAQVAAWVNYITPVQGAQEAMEDVDPELVDNEWIFPTEATLASARIFRTLEVDEEERFLDQFDEVIGG